MQGCLVGEQVGESLGERVQYKGTWREFPETGSERTGRDEPVRDGVKRTFNQVVLGSSPSALTWAAVGEDEDGP